MAESIIIRFGTKALDAAKAQAQAIAQALRGSKDLLRGLSADARKTFKASIKAGLKEREEAIDLAQKRLANVQAQRAQRGKDPEIDAAVARALAQVSHGVGRLYSFAGGLEAFMSSDDPGGAKGLELGLRGLHAAAPSLGAIGGPVATLIAIMGTHIVAALAAESAKNLATFEARVSLRIEAALAEANVAERYKDDPTFRAAEQRRARALYVHDAALGWEPRSGGLLGGD